MAPRVNDMGLNPWSEIDEYFDVDTQWEARQREASFEDFARDGFTIVGGKEGRRRRAPPVIMTAERLVESHNRRAGLRGALCDLTPSEWRKIVSVHGLVCVYCLRPCEPVLEHIVAIEMGGGTTKDNVAPACRSCNSAKRSRSVEDFAEARGLSVEAIHGRLAAIRAAVSA